MAQQKFKFEVCTTKFGDAKIKTIKANSLEEAKQKLFADMNHPALTFVKLIPCSLSLTKEQVEYYQSVNPITNFDFNYKGEFYLNYINKL
jgi:hypothetical protein